eukprot:6905830-Pyramimonas_sp.AAC.1
MYLARAVGEPASWYAQKPIQNHQGQFFGSLKLPSRVPRSAGQGKSSTRSPAQENLGSRRLTSSGIECASGSHTFVA